MSLKYEQPSMSVVVLVGEEVVTDSQRLDPDETEIVFAEEVSF